MPLLDDRFLAISRSAVNARRKFRSPTLWLLSIVAFIVAGFVLMRREPDDTAANAAYWIGGAFLLSPHAWWYQILFLYPAAFVVLSRGSNHARLFAWGCLLAIALVGTGLLGSGFAIFKAWGGFFFISCAILILFVRQVWHRPLGLSKTDNGTTRAGENRPLELREQTKPGDLPARSKYI
jgi:hypothetical protein